MLLFLVFVVIAMFKCPLKNKHSKKDFNSGVDMLQTGNGNTLNGAEKDACVWLLKKNHPLYKKKAVAGSDDDEELLTPTPAAPEPESDFDMGAIFDSGIKDMEEGLRERDSEYINLDFLLGSAAIVECLWSKFDALVILRRRGMSPIMVEGILYLKENRDLWGIEDVKEALRRVKENEKKERTKKKMQAHQDEELQIAAEALLLGTQGGVSGVVDYSE